MCRSPPPPPPPPPLSDCRPGGEFRFPAPPFTKSWIRHCVKLEDTAAWKGVIKSCYYPFSGCRILKLYAYNSCSLLHSNFQHNVVCTSSAFIPIRFLSNFDIFCNSNYICNNYQWLQAINSFYMILHIYQLGTFFENGEWACSPFVTKSGHADNPATYLYPV